MLFDSDSGSESDHECYVTIKSTNPNKTDQKSTKYADFRSGPKFTPIITFHYDQNSPFMGIKVNNPEYPFGWNKTMYLISICNNDFFKQPPSTLSFVNPNKETVLEMAVQNVVNVEFTLRVAKHLRENPDKRYNTNLEQSIIYALNNDQLEIAKYLFSTLNLSTQKHSITENLKECLFDDYQSFILDYEKHENHELMKFFKNELISKNNDDFIRKAIWKWMEMKENKYGKAVYCAFRNFGPAPKFGHF